VAIFRCTGVVDKDIALHSNGVFFPHIVFASGATHITKKITRSKHNRKENHITVSPRILDPNTGTPEDGQLG
jgi:methyl coenzyme M reductase subunit C